MGQRHTENQIAPADDAGPESSEKRKTSKGKKKVTSKGQGKRIKTWSKKMRFPSKGKGEGGKVKFSRKPTEVPRSKVPESKVPRSKIPRSKVPESKVPRPRSPTRRVQGPR